MAAYSCAGIPVILFIATVAILLQAESALGFPTTLTLERAFLVDLNKLRHRDSFRHSRILKQSSSSEASYTILPVQGAYDPHRAGLYYATLKLGSPPKHYHVQIDTGSDVSWVSCTSCKGCPRSTGLRIPIQFYDPSTSSTASLISCSDKRCLDGTQSSDFGFSNSDDHCSYTLQYGDGSGTSAHAVDGVLGLGKKGISVIAQLSSQGIIPNTFSHCLAGAAAAAGFLTLGQIAEPNMVYTPLIPSRQHYNVNLLSISVNGQTLPIDPSVFAISSSREGTVIDSGSSLAYLPGEAYDPFLDAIIESVSLSVDLFFNQCFLVNSSTLETFPNVSLNFGGGASMLVRPQDYLLQQQNSLDGRALRCFGFQRMPDQEITILGDLVLKDKLVVYDLGGQRIGWRNYDCFKTTKGLPSNNRSSENVNVGSSSLILMAVVLFVIFVS